MSNKLLNDLNLDYLLVCCTNEFLVEYPALSENARYTLTGFSGSTGDALMTKDNIYLFVDGRYHTQADNEVKEGVTVVKLKLGQKQDDEIRKLIEPQKTLGIVAKKVSQTRLETFKNYKIKLLDKNKDYQKIEYQFKDKQLGIEIDFLLGFKESTWKLWIGKIGAISYDDDPWVNLDCDNFADAIIKCLDYTEEFIDDVKENKDNWPQFYI